MKAFTFVATKDWCPRTGRHVHSFHDWGSWVDHRHPQCEACGYVDVTRTLEPLR